jgi:hypothetical protein
MTVTVTPVTGQRWTDEIRALARSWDRLPQAQREMMLACLTHESLAKPVPDSSCPCGECLPCVWSLYLHDLELHDFEVVDAELSEGGTREAALEGTHMRVCGHEDVLRGGWGRGR